MIGMNLKGAFPQRLRVPEGCLVPVPPSLPAAAAALTEPAATVVHALALAARASVTPLAATHALVLGAGAIGLLAVLLLRSRGVAALSVVETNPHRAAALERATGSRRSAATKRWRGPTASTSFSTRWAWPPRATSPLPPPPRSCCGRARDDDLRSRAMDPASADGAQRVF
jgi:D-arabinose 1-dehydrogenase-like Zn-dependent alcohol dehydrogenase